MVGYVTGALVGLNDGAIVGDLVGPSVVGYVTGAHVGFTDGNSGGETIDGCAR